MLSIAQIDHGPAPGEDPLLDRVATAAFDSFVEYGIRRSTIEDVATRCKPRCAQAAPPPPTSTRQPR